MSREFPDRVDPWKAADGRRTFAGTMPLKRFARLAPLLAPAEAHAGSAAGSKTGAKTGIEWSDARFSAAFERDAQGLVVVDLRVEAQLPLVCQRSLEPYLEPVQRHSVLAVIGSAGEQDRVPEHYEPVLAEQGRMALQDLVEEELLLALPEVPRNPEIAAVRQSTGPGGEKAAEPARGAQDGPEDDSEKDPENGSGRRYRPFAGLADLIRTRKG